MIGRDEPFALVIVNNFGKGSVSQILNLGHKTLESWEMDKVQDMLGRRGLHAYLMNVYEVDSFYQILQTINDQ